ncbi:MAG: hypothetical protein O2782_21775 [bacterium]|nr:hypothetical protein [bacterium]
MRHAIVLLVAMSIVSPPALLHAQDVGTVDTRVYLTDGTVVMGQLLEKSADLVIVRSSDGEIFTFQPEQIDKLVTLDSLGSQAQTITVREFPYISFLGGTVALSLISWLQFDTAGDRDAEADVNQENGLLARANELQDKASRARLWGWSSAILAAGSLGVALIPKSRTKKVFPELSLDASGGPRAQLVYRHTF